MKTGYCFDLDGTITAQEILPLIAAEVDLYDEIQALTEATIKGVLPFNSSFRLRCKLLSDVPISRVNKIVSKVPLFPSVLEFIQSQPDNCYVITGNLDVWVSGLLDRIGARCYSSTADFKGDQLLGVAHIIDKGEAVKALRSQYDRIVAIGDGVGDLTMFESSDVKIAFGGVHPPIEAVLKSSDLVCGSEQALMSALRGLSRCGS